MNVFYNDVVITDEKLVTEGQLDICPNTISVITGDNGCGKTLLLKNIMLNNSNNDYNTVLLDQDNDVTISSKSVLESIAMSDSDEVKKIVREKIKELDYEYMLDLNNGNLSGGEQRLVNILRCVCFDADLLLIDEPTNDLDYKTAEEVINLLVKLKEFKTIIVVSHDDRILDVADNIFKIENKKVCVVKCIQLKAEQRDKSNDKSNKISTSFLQKTFKYSFVSLFAFFVLCFIIFLQMESYKGVAMSQKEGSIISENQIYICSAHSEFMGDCSGDNDVLPIFAVYTLGNMNPIDLVNTSNKVTEFYNSVTLPLNDLKLKSTDNYLVYPLEYISKDGKESINVLDYYLKKYYGKSTSEVYLDTSNYFYNIVQENFEYEDSYFLDINCYNKCIIELEKDNTLMMIAEAVVLKEGYTSFEFYKEKEIERLANSFACVFSREVNDLFYQLSFTQEIVREFKIIVCTLLILIIINLLFVKLQMMAIKKQIFLFKNYGVDFDFLLDNLIKKLNNRLPLLLAFALFSGIFIINLNNLQFSQVHFIFIMYAATYCSITYTSVNWLIKRYLKNYYRWDAR